MKNKTKYFINEEKGIVVAKITMNVYDIFGDDEKEFVGKAKCLPEDDFNFILGKKLAYNRAVLKMEKYLLKRNKTIIDKAYEMLVIPHFDRINKTTEKLIELEKIM